MAHSKWVLDVFERWLSQINDPEVIGLMVAKCKTRAAEIVQQQKIDAVRDLLASYSSCKTGDTMYLTKPWLWFTELEFAWWKPRRRSLYFFVPKGLMVTPANTVKWKGREVFHFDLTDINTHQPSRCEAHLRRKL